MFCFLFLLIRKVILCDPIAMIVIFNQVFYASLIVCVVVLILLQTKQYIFCVCFLIYTEFEPSCLIAKMFLFLLGRRSKSLIMLTLYCLI